MQLNTINNQKEYITQQLNIIAKNSGLHSLLVMQSMPTEMIVFASNEQEIYSSGDSGPKGNQAGCHELYCERVVDLKQPLLVEDAVLSNEWKENEDLVKFGLGTYYGVPITFKDEVIGTVCALNRSPVDFSTGTPSIIKQINNLKTEIEIFLQKAS
jgi:GAF domain-containing protein